MAKAELDIGLRFEGAVVRPGDTLILLTKTAVATANAEWIRSAFAEHIPGVAVAFVEGFEQALVYRPESPAMHIYGTRGPAGTWCTRQDGAIGDRAEATCPACIQAYDAGPETPYEREMYSAWSGKAA